MIFYTASYLVHVDRDVSTPFNFPASQITNKKKKKKRKENKELEKERQNKGW